MAQQLNLPTYSAYTLPMSLDNIPITLRIVWNTRVSSWFLDVRDSKMNVIEEGIRLSINQPLIVFGIDSWRAEGNLFIIPTSSETVEKGGLLTRNNFGGENNYQMLYVPREEFEAFHVTDSRALG
jgi:hypothetical protein